MSENIPSILVARLQFDRICVFVHPNPEFRSLFVSKLWSPVAGDPREVSLLAVLAAARRAHEEPSHAEQEYSCMGCQAGEMILPHGTFRWSTS